MLGLTQQRFTPCGAALELGVWDPALLCLRLQCPPSRCPCGLARGPHPSKLERGRELRRGESLSFMFCCACCLQGPAEETELDGTSGALPQGTSSWVCLRYHSPSQPKFHKSVHFFSVWFPARISIPSPNLNQDRCSTQIILPWYHLHLTCPAPCVDCPPLLQQITPSVILVNSKLDCGVASCTVISPKFFLYFLGGFLLVISVTYELLISNVIYLFSVLCCE